MKWAAAAQSAQRALGALGIDPRDVLRQAGEAIKDFLGLNRCADWRKARYRAIVQLADPSEIDAWIREGVVRPTPTKRATGTCNEYALRVAAIWALYQRSLELAQETADRTNQPQLVRDPLNNRHTLIEPTRRAPEPMNKIWQWIAEYEPTPEITLYDPTLVDRTARYEYNRARGGANGQGGAAVLALAVLYGLSRGRGR